MHNARLSLLASKKQHSLKHGSVATVTGDSYNYVKLSTWQALPDILSWGCKVVVEHSSDQRKVGTDYDWWMKMAVFLTK